MRMVSTRFVKRPITLPWNDCHMCRSMVRHQEVYATISIDILRFHGIS